MDHLDPFHIGKSKQLPQSVLRQHHATRIPSLKLDLAGRFHWLVAPRSTIIQTSPVHSGLCTDPAAMLDHIFETLVEVYSLAQPTD